MYNALQKEIKLMTLREKEKCKAKQIWTAKQPVFWHRSRTRAVKHKIWSESENGD